MAAVAVVALAAACSTTVPGRSTPAQSSAGGESTASVAAPASTAGGGAPNQALRKYYDQSIAWGSCSSFAATDDFDDPGTSRLQCGTITVPIDYSNPGAGDATIAVDRLLAQGTKQGSLLVNPGGPGGSGVQLVGGSATNWSKLAVNQTFDMVGWDPRGVGASTPTIRCYTDAQVDANRQSTLGDDNSPEGIIKQEAFNKENAELCDQKMGTNFLAHVGTADTVQDLDVLRSVLGDKKLSYIGFSYGTFIGAIYAEKFPHNIRAMVLDGAVDPSEDPSKSNVRQMAGFQTVFDDYAKDCAKSAACPLGTDPTKAVDNYHKLVWPLIDHPVPASPGRPLSYQDAATGTIQAMYSPNLWRALTVGLAQLRTGTGTMMQRLADAYQGRDANGHYSGMMDAFTAINCMDSPAITDPVALGRLDTELRQAAPFNDDGRGTGHAAKGACAYWPAKNTLSPHRVVVPADMAKVVVVSTTHDPATPYANGVSLANQLNAALITFEGSQHTASFEGNTCVDGAVTRYFQSLTVPPAGLRCSE
ncbi:alpha/beta hydrolase [Tsukamurella soli]|uniref:Alpha/beta hydrolase n=1 Tax=Tsukamurella soli TaxID=644556 RepID=A0ABP8JR80_9ACTN